MSIESINTAIDDLSREAERWRGRAETAEASLAAAKALLQDFLNECTANGYDQPTEAFKPLVARAHALFASPQPICKFGTPEEAPGGEPATCGGDVVDAKLHNLAERAHDIQTDIEELRALLPVAQAEGGLASKILALGHNDDCLFCGFKDKAATESLRTSPLPVEAAPALREALKDLTDAALDTLASGLPVAHLDSATDKARAALGEGTKGEQG